jgi:hypothetical protein
MEMREEDLLKKVERKENKWMKVRTTVVKEKRLILLFSY